MSGFLRVAVVNRGEAAVRFLQTAADFRGSGIDGLTTIALYTSPDRHSLFVRWADEAYDLDTFPTTEPGKPPYLDHDRLLAALRAVRADLVWAGWGFVAEDADFVEACEEAGITFIGPSSVSMRLLADKVRAKQLAESVDVPVVPWSHGPLSSLEEASAQAEQIGYPLLVKSAAGGGGMGIREVSDAQQLKTAVASARGEGERAFGDGTVYLEKRIDGGRHVEVQVLADGEGTVWPVGVRECSIQRRRQKVVEEAGLSVPDPQLERKVREWAVRVCRAAGYRNAGTVEFLVDEASGEAYFMEVNTRLQVEHTVTELTTGLDLVGKQLSIAAGGGLAGEPPAPDGHAIEVRLNAEDPDQGFAPAPGRVAIFRPPNGPGVRVDTGIEQGDVISGDFDPMVAKIIAVGPDRPAALRRLRRALEQTDIVVQGGATNKPFLLEILTHPDVPAGAVHTGWLDERVAHADLRIAEVPAVALTQAAVEAFRDRRRRDRDAFVSSAMRGRAELGPEQTGSFTLGYRDALHTLEVSEPAPGRYRVIVDGTQHVDVVVELADGQERTLRIAEGWYRTFVTATEDGYVVDIAGTAHRITAGERGVVRAGFPGMVVSLLVAEGDQVGAGDALVVVESMKLESTVTAPVAGTVREVAVSANSHVIAGQPLVSLDTADGTAGDGGDRSGVCFGAVSVRDDEPIGPLELLRPLVLGLNVPAAQHRDLAGELATEPSGSDDEGWQRAEIEVLTVLGDLHALAPRPISWVARPEENLMSHLRDRGHEDYKPSDEFTAALEAAVAHFGSTGSVDSTDWDLHLMWIYRSWRRLPVLEPAVVAILARWLRADVLPEPVQAVRRTLDRLVEVMDGRSPRICGLARAVRSRFFVEPVLERGRAEVARRLRARAVELGSRPDSPERVAGLRAVGLGAPWERWLAEWVLAEPHPPWDAVLTVLLASIYQHRRLSRIDIPETGAVALLAAEERSADGPTSTVVAAVDPGDGEAGATLAAVLAERARYGPVAVELVRPSGSPELDPALTGALRSASRVTVLAFPASPRGRVTSTTYEPDPSADDARLREQPLYRNLHPMVAERIELWRLSDFELTSVDTFDGTWLFAGTSREDSRDQRLFAFAEVEDLGTIQGTDSVSSVPDLELALTRCFTSIRHHDSGYRSRSPYGWNRVIIHVRPVWHLPLDALRDVAERVAHAARGLSLDQVVIRLRTAHDQDTPEDAVVHMVLPPNTGVQIGVKKPSARPVSTLRGYRRVAAEMRRRGLIHPWEIIRLLTSPGAVRSDLPAGRFEELDLDDDRLVPVDREPGGNTAGVVIGVVTNTTDKHPEGMRRVLVLSDASKRMASLGEPECARIVAALRFAEDEGIPVEWFAASSGARVAMDSGTENLDWTARVLRQIVEMTGRGHEINVVLAGVNVGAQSYWDAEATMLMHTKGILVAVADQAMVLTGKQALDYSGAVSADNNAGIGGYDRIMGPNGEAQYWAATIEEACELLFRHYECSYIAPGEQTVRPRPTPDPVARPAGAEPHHVDGPSDFATVGDVFDDRLNADRKKPFDIRSVMRAVHDRDAVPLERWPHMGDAENAVVWDGHLGGQAVTLIGIESRDLPRHSVAANDGPRRWSAGTLFPRSSKKVARALNAASGVRPVVVLANLSGFDGSPESMRELQLEYGAEIGRAVVNLRGPLVFCVLSRYHGGAFVVFSKALNDRMEVIALKGAKASVLGGVPAAAVVFSRDVAHRTQADPRVRQARERAELAAPSDRLRAEEQVRAVEEEVSAELRGVIGREFDAVHTIERARQVGSVDRVIGVDDLRPAIVGAIARSRSHENAEGSR